MKMKCSHTMEDEEDEENDVRSTERTEEEESGGDVYLSAVKYLELVGTVWYMIAEPSLSEYKNAADFLRLLRRPWQTSTIQFVL